jgi:hypothetical protein
MIRRGLAWATFVGVAAVTTWWLWDAHGTPDVDIWLGWTETMLAQGPRAGFAATATDYPPGSLLILWMVGLLAQAGVFEPRLGIKWLVFGFLFANSVVLLLGSRRPGLAAATHGALVVNAIGLGYLDVLFAPFVTGAAWAARANRVDLMMVLLASACLMKWQPLLVLPFAAIYAIRQRDVMSHAGWMRAMRIGLGITLAVALVVLAVFGTVVFESFYRASRHHAMSYFGANPLWLATWWLERDSPERAAAGGIVSVVGAPRPMLRVLTFVMLVAYGWLLRRYWKTGDPTLTGWLRYSLLGYLVYCMVSAGVHENHLFLASLLGFLLWWQDARWWKLAVAVALAANLNLVAFYGFTGYTTRTLAAGIDATVWVAVFNVVLLAVVAATVLRYEPRTTRQTVQTGPPFS